MKIPNLKNGSKIVIVIMLCSLLLIYYYESLDFVPLDVPAPLSYLPNGNWDEILYITQHFVGDYGRILIMRKEGRAYGIDRGYSFDSTDDIMKYFTDHLAREGWSPVPPDWPALYKCQSGLPEKEYAPDILYEEYVKIGVDPEKSDDKICVAVIPQLPNSWENQKNFKVIIISSRYSLLTKFLESFRRW